MVLLNAQELISLIKVFSILDAIVVKDYFTDESVEDQINLLKSLALDTHVLMTPGFVQANGLLEKLNHPEDKILILCDRFTGNILKEMEMERKYFKEGFFWLMENEAILESFPLRLDSDVLLVNKELNVKTIHEAYQIPRYPQITVQPLAEIKEINVEVKDPIKWRRRGNLKGTVLSDSLLPWPGLNELMGNGSYTGFLADILQIMTRKANFSVLSIQPEDGIWGNIYCDDSGSNCNFTGILRDIASGRADFSSAGIDHSPYYTLVLDFLPGLGSSHITLIMKENCIGNSRSDLIKASLVFLSILSKNVWACLASLCILSSLLFALWNCTKKDTKTQSNIVSVAEGAFIVVISTAQRDNNIDTLESGWGIRLGLFVFNVMSFLMYAIYSSQLTAAFATGPLESGPKSFDAVLEEGFQLVVEENQLLIDLLNVLPSKSIPKLLEKAIHVIEDDGPRYVVDGDCRLVTYTYATATVSNPYTTVVKGFKEEAKTQFGFVLPKDSDLYGLLTYLQVQVLESGILEKESQVWREMRAAAGKVSERKESIEKEIQLGIEVLVLPSSFVAAAIAGACAAALLEKLLWKRHLWIPHTPHEEAMESTNVA